MNGRTEVYVLTRGKEPGVRARCRPNRPHATPSPTSKIYQSQHDFKKYIMTEAKAKPKVCISNPNDGSERDFEHLLRDYFLSGTIPGLSSDSLLVS